MKSKIFFAILMLTVSISFAIASDTDTRANDHSAISYLSSFRIYGEIDLRTQKDIHAPVTFRTLNHEGGMNVRVLEILERDVVEGKSGIWLYVRTISPVYVWGGELIEPYADFLIFLSDETPVFDFKK